MCRLLFFWASSSPLRLEHPQGLMTTTSSTTTTRHGSIARPSRLQLAGCVWPHHAAPHLPDSLPGLLPAPGLREGTPSSRCKPPNCSPSPRSVQEGLHSCVSRDRSGSQSKQGGKRGKQKGLARAGLAPREAAISVRI